MQKRHLRRIAMAVILSILMVLQLLAVPMTAIAGELSEDNEEFTDVGEAGKTDDLEEVGESEDIQEESESEISREISEPESQSEISDSDNSVENEFVDSSETSENVSSEESSEANDTQESSTTEDIQEIGEPENSEVDIEYDTDYYLSDEQISMKEDLRDNMDEISEETTQMDYVSGEVIVSADSLEDAQAIADGYNTRLISFEYGLAILEVPQSQTVVQMVAKSSDAGVRLPALWPNYYRTVSGDLPLRPDEEPYLVYGQQDYYHYQWQHLAVGSMYAWNHGYMGENVKVGVIDSGATDIDEELIYEGIENFSDSLSSSDTNGHGTHVAGIIGARANGVGGCGIAPKSSLYAYKVVNSDKTITNGAVVRALNCAVEQGMDVVNISIGGPDYNGVEEEACRNAYSKGTLVVAAAGNEGVKNKSYPAAYSNVISVGATDINNCRTYFSNYGDWVDLAAPGMDILSTIISSKDQDSEYGNTVDDHYNILSGTSMASPVITGVAAVILSASPEIKSKTGFEKCAALEKKLKGGANPAGSGLGKGVVYLPKALNISDATSVPAAPDAKITYASDKKSADAVLSSSHQDEVYYTTDGTYPYLENGLIKNGIKFEDPLHFQYDAAVIRAICVTRYGIASPVKTFKVNLVPVARQIYVKAKGATTIAAGKSTQVAAVIVPSNAVNKKVKWSVTYGSGNGVAISQTGKITTTKNTAPGTYYFEVTSDDDPSVFNTFKIEVIEDVIISKVDTTVKTIRVDYKSTDVVIDLTRYFRVHPAGAEVVDCMDLKWFSSNEEMGTIHPQGYLSVKRPGTFSVTGLADDGSGKKASIKIIAKQVVSYISLDGPLFMAAGKSIQLNAHVNEKAENKKLYWYVEPANEGVTVSNGKVTANKDVSGFFCIRATAMSGVSNSCYVRVCKGAVTAVKTDKKELTVFRKAVNGGLQNVAYSAVTLEGTPEFCMNAVQVTTDKPSLVQCYVDYDDEKLTLICMAVGNSTGSCKVTLSTTDGSKKKTTVNVKVINPISELHIVPASGVSDILAQGKSLQLKAKIGQNYGKVQTTKLKWSISEGTGIKISSSGKISTTSATAPGLYTATAETTDGSHIKNTYFFFVTEPIATLEIGGLSKNTKLPAQAIGEKCTFAITKPQTSYEAPILVQSSNGSVCFPQIEKVYDEGGNESKVLRLSVFKKGSATIKVKILDGSNRTFTYKVTIG